MSDVPETHEETTQPTPLAQMETLRKQADKLPPNVCMLGWFGARPGETHIPVNRLEVGIIYRSESERRYASYHKPKRSAIQINVPAIYGDSIRGNKYGEIHIGGRDWRFFFDRYNIKYTCEKDVKNAMYVGYMRDLFAEGKSLLRYHINPSMPGKHLDLNLKLLGQATEMLDTHYVESDSFRYPEKQIRLPHFLSPVGRYTKLQLRDSALLEELVLNCARTGNWAVKYPWDFGHPIVAPTRGTIKRLDKTQVLFRSDAEDEEKWQVTIDYRNASKALEDRITDVFGVNVGLDLLPQINIGDEMKVKAYHSIFGPVPRRNWSLNELKKEKCWEALRYLAALTTSQLVKGSCMLDHALAFSSETPWVDFVDLPWLVQKLEYPNPWEYRGEHPLRLRAPGVRIDLLDVPVKHHIKELARKRSNERKDRAQQHTPKNRLEGPAPQPSTPLPGVIFESQQ